MGSGLTSHDILVVCVCVDYPSSLDYHLYLPKKEKLCLYSKKEITKRKLIPTKNYKQNKKVLYFRICCVVGFLVFLLDLIFTW